MESIALTDPMNPRPAFVPRLDDSVSVRLAGVTRRLKRLIVIEGIGWLSSCVLVSTLIQFLLDYSTRGLQWSMRAALLALLAVTAAWVLMKRIIAPVRLRVEPADAANWLEKRYPKLSSLLVSAVRFTQGDIGSPETNSPELIAAAVSRSAEAVRDLDFDVVLNPRRAQRGAAVAVSSLLVALAAAWSSPTLVSIWFQRNVLLRDVSWPRNTHIVVDAKDGRVVGARGDDMVITARADGVQPREVEFRAVTASGKTIRETMVTVGSEGALHYRFTLKNAQEDFEFRLLGGDDETQPINAVLLERPRVESAELHVIPPSYTRLEPYALPSGERTVQTFPGSKLTIIAQTSKPIVHAALMAGNRPVADAKIQSNELIASLVPTESQTLHFALRDADGLDDRQPAKFAVRIVKDESPRARLAVHGVGELITPQAVIPFELEFSDNLGLSEVGLKFSLLRETPRVGKVELSGFQPHLTTFSSSVSWSVSSEEVIPGDRISLMSEASDFDDVSGPNKGRSPEMTFRVVTVDELLAELARREQEFRQDFERLVDAQEQLRGRLLTLMGPYFERENPSELPEAVSNAERRQINIAGSVNVVRQQVEQVLSELRINQLATTAAEERLGKGILGPLTALVRRDFSIAADTIRQWSRNRNPENARKIDDQQTKLLADMRAILANMIEWQGYQEAVNMLRDVLRLQNELRTETKEAVEQQGQGIFDD